MSPTSVLHSNRAAAYMKLGWWQQAFRDTKVALRKDASNIKALDRQGRCLFYLDRFEEVLELANKLEGSLLAEQEMILSAKQLRCRVHLCWQPQSLDECEQAWKELGTKEYMLSPLGSRLGKALAEALLQRSDTIDNARNLKPAATVNRVVMEQELGSISAQDDAADIASYGERTLIFTQELQESNPSDPDICCLYSRALVRLGRHADAESQLQRCLENSPGHESATVLLETLCKLEAVLRQGLLHYDRGSFLNAVQVYTAGLEIDPGCVDTHRCAQLYYRRSSARRCQGDFFQALDDVNMSLVLSPKWANALYCRGILLLECGKPADALVELKAVQRADPTLDQDLPDWIRRAHNFLTKSAEESIYYRFMQVPMDATSGEIKTQYRKLCLLWHPDKNQTAEGAEQFSTLQKIFAILMDDEQRSEYDYGKWKGRDVCHYMKRRIKVKDDEDDCITLRDTLPWIERSREAREWFEKQDATADPEWLGKRK